MDNYELRKGFMLEFMDHLTKMREGAREQYGKDGYIFHVGRLEAMLEVMFAQMPIESQKEKLDVLRHAEWARRRVDDQYFLTQHFPLTMGEVTGIMDSTTTDPEYIK